MSGVSALNAVTIVSWGPATDIVTGQQGTIGGEGSSSIDFSTPSNPAIGSSYYPNNTGHSPLFYFASTASAGNLDVRILDNGANNDEFRMAMNKTSDPYVVDGNIAIVWTKDGNGSNYGFLNGGDSNPTELTSLSATFNSNGSSNFAFVDIRWIIRLGEDFYISENFNFSNTPSLPDPSAASWFDYNPATGASGDITVIGSAATLGSFNDLTATGFMLEFDQTNTGNIYLIPEMTSFTADAVIPEPGAYALMFGAAIGALALMRRKR